MHSTVAMEWIGAILERVRGMECPACGARLAYCAMRGISAEPKAVVVRLACTVCGESSVAVVERNDVTASPLTTDDVLDAHEFLKGWDGRVAEVLTTSRP